MRVLIGPINQNHEICFAVGLIAVWAVVTAAAMLAMLPILEGALRWLGTW